MNNPQGREESGPLRGSWQQGSVIPLLECVKGDHSVLTASIQTEDQDGRL